MVRKLLGDSRVGESFAIVEKGKLAPFPKTESMAEVLQKRDYAT